MKTKHEGPSLDARMAAVKEAFAYIEQLARDTPDGAQVIRQALVGAQWEWLVQHHRGLTGLVDFERLFQALGRQPPPTGRLSGDTNPPGSPA